MNTYVDIHVLQSVPPSCINRDDTGSPKSAVYGGVSRARVSSQSWKRAVRLDFNRRLDVSEIGRRTKRVVAEVAGEIIRRHPDMSDAAEEMAVEAFGAAGIKVAEPKRKKAAGADEDMDRSRLAESGYLLFLSAAQVSNLAEMLVRVVREGGTEAIKAHKKEIKASLSQDNSVDIALFGRMVAEDADLNVDAACQVAHALSTHAVSTEFDFFTAVDDVKNAADGEDAGAGMMGTVEFNSATLYRFATINVDALRNNLGSDKATVVAMRQFIRSFVLSMPTGKINTFANQTLPEVVVLSLRDDQPVSWVGAFESPVRANGSGIMSPSVAAMLRHASSIDAMYGHVSKARWAAAMPDFADSVGQIAEVGPLPVAIDSVVEAAASSVGLNMEEQ